MSTHAYRIPVEIKGPTSWKTCDLCGESLRGDWASQPKRAECYDRGDKWIGHRHIACGIIAEKEFK